MKISTSILSVENDYIKNAIDKLNNTDTDYIHLDIMDGIFVPNENWSYEFLKERLVDNKKPLDVHLMVSDVKKYIDLFSNFNPVFITFHYEAISEVGSVTNYIKSKNIKVGLAIKPATDVSEIVDYLPYVDLALVMSVEPGKGGQTFIENSVNKIEDLYKIRENQGYNYLIEVDGGINSETIKGCSKVDIAVAGKYVTSNDYQDALNNLKK